MGTSSGLQANLSNGQASSSGVYSGGPPYPGSNNIGSLGRSSVMRRLHDSGFSPDMNNSDQILAEDELMHLLDLIQLRSEKLKSEIAQDGTQRKNSSNTGLHAISEDDVTEVEQLRRERLLLLQRVAELESGSGGGNMSGHSSSGHSKSKEPTGNVSAGESESSISGIVHSVHIRTGQQDPSSSGSPVISQSSQSTIASFRRPAARSISQSDLNKSNLEAGSNSVHIEIKNMSKSQDQLSSANPSRILRSSTSGSSRRSSISSALSQQVSVVNLKHASVDNLPQQVTGQAGGGKNRYLSPNRQTSASTSTLFGQPLTTKSQILQRPNSLLPGRMVMGIKARTQSNPKLKSHSVENLIDPSSTILGLKPANSEMNMVNALSNRRRLSGTTSELNMTRIGTSEKVKVFETLEGVTSLPVELTKGLRGQVRPNRDKIRTILSMNNVIELQRHLLTTVMENEVNFFCIYDTMKHKLGISIWQMFFFFMDPLC